MTVGSFASLTLNRATDSSSDQPLGKWLAQAEAQVRAQPVVGRHRWMLFQLLCVLECWDRAVQQLQVCAQLSPELDTVALAYRDLIREERRRARVLTGCERPGFVFDTPSWVDGLLDALRFAAAGELDEADIARRRALDEAPLVPVRNSERQLDWIAGSDSRLGPVCELITAGCYRWLPFSDIAAWHIERPNTLLDLIWAPCVLTLVDGSAVRGFMPARYPSVANAAGDRDESDALPLGRKTIWQEVGRTGVIAEGQKTWATSAGDFSLFELPTCDFGQRMAGNEHAQKDGPR
ncbi:ImpE/SciE family protein [Paraburkholderia caledonica]|nr:type VI secretion system accessory protein TagJ [Paraburkholderia caledonica]AXF13438.1 ImpE/SciE family protein [Paraburkholderia caledonica]